MDFIFEYWPVIAGVLMIFSIMAVVKIAANHYVKASPSEALVVYGGGSQAIVVGGAKLVIPFMHKFDRLDLRTFQLEPEVHNVASKEKVPVNVSAIATVRLSSEAGALKLAAARFLGKTPDEIKHTVLGIITPALRGVVADMNIIDLIENRQSFATKVAEHIKSDLGRMGIEVDSLQVGNISDNAGVIESLGQEEAAKAKTKAAIGVAKAEQDRATQVAEAEKIKAINVAEAKRESDVKSSEALRVGETAKANATAAIEVARAEASQTASDAQRALATKQAGNDAIVQAEQAKIPILAEKAATEQQKALNRTRVEAEQERIEAETELQRKAQELKEAEMQATVITPALRHKDAKLIAAEADAAANAKIADGRKVASIIDANAAAEASVIKAKGDQEATVEKATGDQQAKQMAAQAERYAQEQTAEAARILAERQADGRKALAEALKTEMLAQAEGELQQMLAQAEGKERDLFAIANGEKASRLALAEGERELLLAKAEGVLKQAQALQALNQTGQLLKVLEALPAILDSLGIAGNKIGEGWVAPVGEAIGKGLANIRNMNIVELGGGNGQGTSSLERFATMVPELMVKALNTADFTGLMGLAQQLGDKLGIDLKTVMVSLAEAGMAAQRPVPSHETAAPLAPQPIDDRPVRDAVDGDTTEEPAVAPAV